MDRASNHDTGSGEGVLRDIVAARSDHVARVIRNEILDGTFAPGSPLREAALAGRFGVSRRTIREALLSLSEQGLVSRRHNTGAAVRRFTAHDISDLYRVRRMLECEGARNVAGADHHRLADVDDAFDALLEAAQGGSSSVALAEADMAFHGAVIALSGSPAIDEFYERISAQMTYAITILQRQDPEPSMTDGVVAEHRAIRDALAHRDLYEAQRLILEHIGTYERVLLATTVT